MAATDVMGQLAGMLPNGLGFWALAALGLFLVAFLLIVAAAAFSFAVQKSWIILKWPITVVVIKPSGDSLRPFMDAAAVINQEGGVQKWKLKSSGAIFDPPGREYILPGDIIFAWSSNFKEITPMKINVVGYKMSRDPAIVSSIMANANGQNMTDAEIKKFLDKIKVDNPELVKRIITTLPDYKELRGTEEGKRSLADQARDSIIAREVQRRRQEYFNSEIDKYDKKLQRTDMVLNAKVDTGLINSMLMEGQRILEEHKLKTDLLTLGLVVILLFTNVMQFMFLVAQGMSYNDSAGKQAAGSVAMADAVHENNQILNQTILKGGQVMRPG